MSKKKNHPFPGHVSKLENMIVTTREHQTKYSPFLRAYILNLATLWKSTTLGSQEPKEPSGSSSGLSPKYAESFEKIMSCRCLKFPGFLCFCVYVCLRGGVFIH